MPWYDGPTLMHHLEHVHVASDRDLVDTRFPVQYVVRPKSDEYHDYRGYAGQVAGGVLKPGDEVVVLPSGHDLARSQGIDLFDQEIDEAFPPMSVTVRLEDDVDVSPRRHDRPGQERPEAQPGHRRDDLLDDQRAAAPAPEARDQAHHPHRAGRWSRTSSTASTSTPCTATRRPRSSASTRSAASSCAPPCRCCATPTRKNRTTGSFILIDEATGVTVGAGMINNAS